MTWIKSPIIKRIKLAPNIRGGHFVSEFKTSQPNSVDLETSMVQYGVANTSGVNLLAAKFPVVKTTGFRQSQPAFTNVLAGFLIDWASARMAPEPNQPLYPTHLACQKG